jgi:hypothetical protein
MVEGRFRLPGGAGCCLQTDIENVAPFRVKIEIFLQYLVLVLMRGSEFWINRTKKSRENSDKSLIGNRNINNNTVLYWRIIVIYIHLYVSKASKLGWE